MSFENGGTRDGARDERLVAALLGKTVRSGDCLLYTGFCNPKGYGRIHRAGRLWLAHRWLYEAITGTPVPRHLVVMHSCDRPSCVNIEHLSVGTHAQNQADSWKRTKRRVRGRAERIPDATIAEIRRRRANGEKIVSIALDLGVSRTHASNVCVGRHRG